MSNDLRKYVEAAVTQAATALGLPSILEPAIVDLLETIAQSADVASAIRRAKQNALADAEDLAAEEAAEQLIKSPP